MNEGEREKSEREGVRISKAKDEGKSGKRTRVREKGPKEKERREERGQ